MCSQPALRTGKLSTGSQGSQQQSGQLKGELSADWCGQTPPASLAPFAVYIQKAIGPSAALLSILLKLGDVLAFGGRSIVIADCSWYCAVCPFSLSRCSVLPNKGKTCVSQCCDKSEV